MNNEDKEYDEVFYRDDRNRQGGPKAKKRTNIREVRRRMDQIQKRYDNQSGDAQEDLEPVI